MSLFNVIIASACAALVWLPAQARGGDPIYHFVDLGDGAYSSSGNGINVSGQVSGSFAGPTFSQNELPRRWTNGIPTDLETLNSKPYGIGYSINASGQVAGSCFFHAGGSGGGGDTQAVKWTGTTPTVLNGLGGESVATGINDSGQVAGYSGYDSNGLHHAVRWTGTTPTDLGTLGGTNSYAYGINTWGQVVGASDDGADPPINAKTNAVLWTGATPIDLGNLGGGDYYRNGYSEARAINDSGQVAGFAYVPTVWPDEPKIHAVRWAGGGALDLGTLGGPKSYGYGINSSGHVVGFSEIAAGGWPHAFLSKGAGAMQDLNDLVPPGTPLLVIANAINDRGEITGATSNGRAFLLTTAQSPTPTPTPTPAPLVFIPGVAGSVLKGDVNGLTNHQFWPSIFPWDVQWLNLREGVPNLEAVDVVRDVRFDRADARAAALAAGNNETDVDNLFDILDLFHLWNTPQLEIYGFFVDHLRTDDRYEEFALNGDRSRLTTNFDLGVNASGPIPTLFPFPYDWRLSYDADLETLHAYIQNIRRLHGDSRVDVVAHSAGGLMLRAYILKYGSEDINHMVTVGSPWWGAPKTLYRMLTGNFFELGGLKRIVDTINRSFLKRSLATFPGAYELLPTDYYLDNGGSPVMSENGWNINGEGSSYEVYTSDQFKALINAKTAEAEIGLNPVDVPAKVNDIFHNPFQDDWHADDGIGVSGARYLHICGRQDTPETTAQIVARYETFLGFVLKDRPTFDQLPVEGDGVVPLLSAQRQPNAQNPNQFLAPGALVRVIPGANDPKAEGSAEHVALMHHVQVWDMMDKFLRDQNVPDIVVQSNAVMTETALPMQRISITGNGYVRLRDSLGNQNTKLSNIAVAKIPGLEVAYGGDDPWVDMDVRGDVDFTIQSGTSDSKIEVKVLQLAADGTPLSLRRYRFDATGHLWQAHLSPGGTAIDPLVSIDTNDNGTFEQSEQIAPSNSSGTGPVDNTAPTLGASYSQTMGSVVVTLTAHDDVTANPAIHYTINDGPVENYQTPLSFPSNGNAVLKAFAEDAMGNTSALLTTTVPSPGPTPTAIPGLVGNVSTRLPVGTGDDALIEGFIVQGPTGSTKKILVRAIGPSLIPFGITDALANPTLEIHDASNATVAINNNWKTTHISGLITSDQFAEINGSGVAPSDDLESAIVANLAPGSYTAVVRGMNNTTGTGVVDAYDLGGASPARLANIATRGLVQPGDKLMIAGFVIQNGSVKAVIRAIGPSLQAFGISNALPDTTLQLRDGNGAIVRENDNWQSDSQQAQELESIGLQPSNDLEAALVETLQPGPYTAQVRGKPETTGIGVVQVYFLQ